ncbi:MAG: 5-bromo-4-chloroindolyl phosphate hydrolysis family protein [Rhodobacteraceae bacterium]|nr:5-bromo-4-chloroindolyl phosphate hydrolysis family protein [Paracoccaceae bacterium]
MARRFSGPNSPGGGTPPSAPGPRADPWAGRAVKPSRLRANILFVLPAPLLIRSIGDPALAMLTKLGAAGLLLAGAFLIREGIRAQIAYQGRAIARRPAIPRKIFGAVATGAGVALAAFDAGSELGAAALYGLLAAGLAVAAFGLDPLKDKGMGADAPGNARVARAIDQAEAHLAAITQAAGRAGDRRLAARVERFAQTVRQMCRAVEEDPRDLTAARKYLGVYLMGVRDATREFADIYSRNRDPQARADYEALLDDLETHFTARRTALMADNRERLDIEIEVLRERLAREGIRS